MIRYITVSKSKTKTKWIKELRFFLSDLVLDYPMHLKWYDRISNELLVGRTREAIVVTDNDHVIAAVIIKKTNSEKKICSLKVDKAYRNRGIGSHLFEKSMEYLETDRPLFSISDTRIDEFRGIILRFGFSCEHSYVNKYKHGHTEYSFNGKLCDENKYANNQSLSA